MEPFGDVVFELLDFGFDELEGLFEGVVGEACELKVGVVVRIERGFTCLGYDVEREMLAWDVRGKHRSIRQQAPFASVVQFHTVNSESFAVDKQRLNTFKKEKKTRTHTHQINITIRPPHYENDKNSPSQSCNCLTHVALAYSIGGSRKITWF